MTVDYASYERLLQYKIPEVEHTLTPRDTMLYALGVGLGADPMDEKQLRFVTEKNLAALPTMAVILAAPHAWVKKKPAPASAQKPCMGSKCWCCISRCRWKACWWACPSLSV